MPNLKWIPIGAVALLISFATNADRRCAHVLGNVFLTDSKLPQGAFDYSQYKVLQIGPAFRKLYPQWVEALDGIANNLERPSYENTLTALEDLNAEFNDFLVKLEAESLMNQSSPLSHIHNFVLAKHAEFSNRALFNEKLFERIKSLYLRKDELKLSPVQRRLLERVYDEFVTNGATLTPEQKNRISEINETLPGLQQQFGNNVLADAKVSILNVQDRNELTGLPEPVLQRAAAFASENGRPGWDFQTTASALMTLLKVAENRDFRRRLWELSARGQRAGATDNRPLALQIAQLRKERANILAFATYGDLVMRNRMAERVSTVNAVLERYREVYTPQAKAEVAEMEALSGFPIEPWDVAYFENKLRVQKLGFDSEDLKPYLQVDNVLKGAMFTAEKLFGVRFERRRDIPTWDKTVSVYEVFEQSGRYMGLFYFDPFARRNRKVEGAWSQIIQVGGYIQGRHQRAHVVNELNIAPPLEGQPALMEPEQVLTLFHEFGHALHELLSDVSIPRFFGTNTDFDAVEVPSQFFERFAFNDEVMAVYARHHQTNQFMPDELIEKWKASNNLLVAYYGLRQVRFNMVDLGWHGTNPIAVTSPEEIQAWEQGLLGEAYVLPTPGHLVSPSMVHIFGGGYAAGYYSYLWSNIIAEDAYNVFLADGGLSRRVGLRFAKTFLSQGGSAPAGDLYRSFKGGDVDPDALLRAQGVLH